MSRETHSLNDDQRRIPPSQPMPPLPDIQLVTPIEPGPIASPPSHSEKPVRSERQQQASRTWTVAVAVILVLAFALAMAAWGLAVW